MIDLKEYVYQTLSALDIPVHYFYPPENADLPCVSWREAENRVAAQADTNEHLTELAYVIDVWGLSAFVNGQKAAQIDTLMAGAGFRRTFAYDLYEPGTKIHHKTMRYRVISDPQQNLTQ